MKYNKPFPTEHELADVARQAHFPLTCRSLMLSIDEPSRKPMHSFLKLFPEEEVFEDATDLITRCEELETLINEERDAPNEYLRSPQE